MGPTSAEINQKQTLCMINGDSPCLEALHISSFETQIRNGLGKVQTSNPGFVIQVPANRLEFVSVLITCFSDDFALKNQCSYYHSLKVTVGRPKFKTKSYYIT